MSSLLPGVAPLIKITSSMSSKKFVKSSLPVGHDCLDCSVPKVLSGVGLELKRDFSFSFYVLYVLYCAIERAERHQDFLELVCDFDSRSHELTKSTSQSTTGF